MKRIITLAIILLSFGNLYAQKSAEFGGQIGFTSYLGDLQPKSLSFTSPGMHFGVQAKYNLNSRFSARLSYNYGQISGDDALSKVAWQERRNLNFRSSISEVALVGEINLLRFGYHSQNYKEKNYFKLVPYLSTGIVLFHFNPRTEYLGQWTDLQPLGTEGQGSSLNSNSKYNLTQIAIPLSLGLKYQLKKNLSCAFEMAWRKTFTDYLDDVSGDYVDFNQLRIENGETAAELSFRGDELVSYDGVPPSMGTKRGTPDNKDWYLFGILSVTYKLFKNHSDSPWYSLKNEE